MFKKTKVRSILELLGKDLSGREVSKVLGVSRNTVAEVQSLFEASGKSWDDIASLDDDRLYDLFILTNSNIKSDMQKLIIPTSIRSLKRQV